MTVPAPELPVVPDLERVMQAPVVTFLARTSEVRLGDVVDSVDGPVHVREIVQRHRWWDLAGDPPGYYIPAHQVRRDGPPEPLIRRRLPRTDLIRVRRTVTKFGPLKGHSKNVHSHAPVKRGWYTDPNGYDAECSCGWKHPDVLGTKGQAAYRWLAHKAGQLSEAAYADNSALLFIATAEVVHRQLPPMPWSFRKITHGPADGGGFAEASVSTLTVEQARAAFAAWRALPGLEDVSFDEYRYEARTPPFDERPGGIAMDQRALGPHRSSFLFTARIEDTTIPAAEVPGAPDGPS
ncbi:hypothetical protein [Streptomyces chartreusis]|uniref:hypothetical protein n=1 Tax=Streptomyces chartreusis TaxID=1969 RepID=UPI0033BFCFE3